MMKGAAARAFWTHGSVCATHPCEVLFVIVTLTLTMISYVDWHKTPSPRYIHPDYHGYDVLFMTIVRCGGILYTYHQFQSLSRIGTKYLFGIAGVIVLFSSLVFCCTVLKLLDCNVTDLKDALFFFLLLIDLSKARFLAQFALCSSTYPEVQENIARGLALLGPSLTLDTIAEALLIGAGTLSGISRVEQMCGYAVLSILVNYVILITFYPSCLSLILELCYRCSSSPPSPSLSPSPSPSPSSPPSPPWQEVVRRMNQVEDTKSNPILQGVKVIMSAGLFLVHGISRWSLDADRRCLSAMELVAGGGGEGRNASGESPSSIVRWLNAGLDHAVLMVILVVLVIKYSFFETSLWPGYQGHSTLVGTGGTDHKDNQKDNHMDDQNQKDNHMDNQKDDLMVNHKDNQSHVGNQEDNLKDLGPPRGNHKRDSCHQEKGEMNKASEIIRSRPTLQASCQTDRAPRRGESPPSGQGGGGGGDPLPPRPLEDCLKIAKMSQCGLSTLTDSEVLLCLRAGPVAHRSLEVALGDCHRAVALRRAYLGDKVRARGALEALPFMHYDYDKVQGTCCENVIGYVPVPVGVAGPLRVNGEEYLVPMATTEGALVASTNRGCKALSLAPGGATSIVYRNGMARGPVVELPSAQRAIEVYRWLKVESNLSILKKAFNSKSRFTACTSVDPFPVGRLLFVRFVATTGDAMGMNMVSQGTDTALKVLKEAFRDLKVVSISGNVCTDKKHSAINWICGRGKSVVCESTLPARVVSEVLKTTTCRMVETNLKKNHVGSSVAGSVGGNNAHAANIIAAIFIACGQDPAQVVESSSCLTVMERTGADLEDLYVSVTMPSIEVGTLGGGTMLPPQAACLAVLGVKGASASSSGENASRLAEIAAAAVMAGELGLMAALVGNALVASHLSLNRRHAARVMTEEEEEKEEGEGEEMEGRGGEKGSSPSVAGSGSGISSAGPSSSSGTSSSAVVTGSSSGTSCVGDEGEGGSSSSRTPRVGSSVPSSVGTGASTEAGVPSSGTSLPRTQSASGLPSTVTLASTVTYNVASNASATASNSPDLDSKSTAITSNVSAVTSNISAVTSNVSAVTSNISAVTSNISAVTSNISAVASNVSAVTCTSPAVTSNSPAVTSTSPTVTSNSSAVTSSDIVTANVTSISEAVTPPSPLS